MRKPSSTLRVVPQFLALLLLSLIPITSSQWIYPENLPENQTLTDYTSGNAEPITDFVIYDGLIGRFSTPKAAFSITRCAKPGRTEPIYPLNSTFTSSKGRMQPDGTWAIMDNHANGMFSNVYNKGSNLWFIYDFSEYVVNGTKGHLCWWELYSVSEEQSYSWNCQDLDVECPHGDGQETIRAVTLIGSDTENYFASTPFIVQTEMREGNRNYTWRNGAGRDNRKSTETIHISNIPTGNASPSTRPTREHGGLLYTILSFIGMFLGY
ncbi:hypothetical protein AJ80_00555 [Polytolypa hystricis UAMH7299]|uniref:Autophagy-related protein 27 n=1 Tax=Polytolypa hystricis (strain UAMH7299) TaxID=1447883 RepID=A0A2B7Z4K5_POLH7|nr:hypothetical protein AJ80_00555 [Polytolypa hystricis UAMH7299]